MKKLIAVLLALSASQAYAEGSVNIASFTLTNDSVVLQSQTSTTTVVCHTLTGILVSSPTTGGVLKIFNSSFTVNAATVAIISLGTIAYYPFNDLQLKGIFYQITNNASGVTILYKK